MRSLAQVGEHLDRTLFVLELPGFESIQPCQKLPSEHFICFLAADFRSASDGDITSLAGLLLEWGASYFVCWGPGCERAHDLVDDVTLLVQSPTGDDSVIMSTWHADETLPEALFFLLTSATPDSAYQDSSNSIVVVSVGDARVDRQIRDALVSPDVFVAKMLG